MKFCSFEFSISFFWPKYFARFDSSQLWLVENESDSSESDPDFECIKIDIIFAFKIPFSF